MKRTILIVILALGLVLCWSMAYAEDAFFVIVGKKQHYAPVQKTGQTTSYSGGDDGDLEKGVSWPDPRFIDNGDGTVTDNLTGLIWLKMATCIGEKNWTEAKTSVGLLQEGSCGLSDGSCAGDWRMPNVRELHSLIDFGSFNPALPSGHPFSIVQLDGYWSSTTYESNIDSSWLIDIRYGDVCVYSKGTVFYVWPVRGGN